MLEVMISLTDIFNIILGRQDTMMEHLIGRFRQVLQEPSGFWQNEVNMINIRAEIIPAIGLGGILLGESLVKYETWLRSGFVKYQQDSLFSVKYLLPEYPIEIGVNIRDGNIYRISALNGYLGKYNNLGIGMPVKQIGCDFTYDDCDEGFINKGIPGLIIEPDIDDPLPDELEKARIGVITVYDPKFFIY